VTYEKSAQHYDLFASKGNLDHYLELAGTTTGRVLELGAGTGRVLLEIAKLDREAVGIDESPAMLREAERKRAELPDDIAGRVRFVLADLLSFDLGTRFGFICSPAGGLHGCSPGDLGTCFRRVADHLADGGVFAFDIGAPPSLRKTITLPVERRELSGGGVVTRNVRQIYDETTDVVSFELIFEVLAPDADEPAIIRESGQGFVLTQSAIEAALREAGFRLRSVAGDFAGNPLCDESRWIVIVAER